MLQLTRRGLVELRLIAVTVVGLAVATSAFAAAATASERQVQSIADSIVATIQSGASSAQKTAKFRSAFTRNADVRTIGTYALGRYARSVSGAQRQQYFSLIDDYVTRQFAKLIINSPVKEVKVTRSAKRGQDTIVTSVVRFSDGRGDAPLMWRMRRGKIIDIAFQGAWIVAAQQKAFESIIRRNNGNIDALLKHMRGS